MRDSPIETDAMQTPLPRQAGKSACFGTVARNAQYSLWESALHLLKGTQYAFNVVHRLQTPAHEQPWGKLPPFHERKQFGVSNIGQKSRSESKVLEDSLQKLRRHNDLVGSSQQRKRGPGPTPQKIRSLPASVVQHDLCPAKPSQQ